MNAITVYALLKKKISALADYVDDLGGGFDYKGSVATVEDLPNNAEVGDSYTVTSEGNAQYTYDGTDWIRINQDAIDEVTKVATSLTEEYDPNETYEAGDVVVHANELYRCKADISTPEEWTDGHWEAVTILDLLGEKVDTATKINGKSLTDDITLNSGDIPYDQTANYNANTAGAKLKSLDSTKVNKTTKINNKPLSGDITLNAGDLGYSSQATYEAGTVGDELQDINDEIEAISTAQINSLFS